MHIVVEHQGHQYDLALIAEDPDALVADLVVSFVGAPPIGPVWIDGRPVSPATPLHESGLVEGSVVGTAGAGTALDGLVTRAEPGGDVLAVVAGPAAGEVWLLDADTAVIGREPGCEAVIPDVTLSARHARLDRHDGQWTATDLGSSNGTWVAGARITRPTPVPAGAAVELGATQLVIRPFSHVDRPLGLDGRDAGVAGTIPFNRPPRAAPLPAPGVVTLPEPPTNRDLRTPLSIAGIVVPVLMGVVMVVAYREPRFALFALMSPLMGIATWLTGRRRAKKARRSGNRAFGLALDRLDAELALSAQAELKRLGQLLPDLVECLRRAELPSVRLWERRPGHPDFLRLRAGTGDVEWDPPIKHHGHGAAGATDPDVAASVVAACTLVNAPVEVDLSAGGVVGVVGDRRHALAMARALLTQVAVHHGPADVTIAVAAATGHASAWDWLKWLPHVRDASGSGRLIATDHDTGHALLTTLAAGAAPDAGRRHDIAARSAGRTLLLVLDDVALFEGRRAPARALLRGEAGPAAGIVIAATEDQLPAMCTAVISVGPEVTLARLRRPVQGTDVAVYAAGLHEQLARDAARRLARYEDPELDVAGAGLPDVVRLLPLLGIDDLHVEAITRRWSENLPDPGPATPVGIGADGPVWVDLKQDGPHGLVGGTTGSGKSELLRSLVAGMAARVDPDHLVFVLVDYKGGSAFDECARLPHTVGMVTDLDEQLGERALRSLEAELRHREHVLRAAGTQDVPEYLRLGAPLGPLPRLVVVIDEFATMAAELPDFLGALVGIAQRGRSLGVHLLLATQRPQGAVNANIKANTNLRIALRVQDQGDSLDIIDQPDAAALDRSTPGRAYVRRGPGEVELAQTAWSTAPRNHGPAAPVRVNWFRAGNQSVASARPGTTGADRSPAEPPDTDLARLVTTIGAAYEARPSAPPRRPWLPMLDDLVPLDAILAPGPATGTGTGRHDPHAANGLVPFALADDPDHQCRRLLGWDPADGHLVLFGAIGSGTSTALLAAVRALCERRPPDDVHVYGIDFGAGALSPLRHLPHVVTVMGAGERELQHRMLRRLRHELDRRRDLGVDALADEPLVVVALDGVGAFLAENDTVETAEPAEWFRRVFTEGAAVGIVFALTGDRPAALPLRLTASVAQRLLFRLSDPGDFATIGLRAKQVPTFVPGRAVDAATSLVVQVGHPGDLEAVGARLRSAHPRPARRPPPIGGLPTRVMATDLPPATLRPVVVVPVGVGDDDLGPAALTFHPTDHALVVGPPRSGKSSALALIAEQLRTVAPEHVLVHVSDGRAPLGGPGVFDAAGTASELKDVLRAAISDPRPWWVFVDDAGRTPAESPVLSALVQSGRPHLHVVAGAAVADLRSNYLHWTRHVRAARTGILLKPDLTLDGDLLGVRLPRRVHTPAAVGRGFVVVNGEATLAQIAVPAPVGRPADTPV